MKNRTKTVLALALIISSASCNAGTISVGHGTLEGTIGLPIGLAYEPGFYVVTDPTGTIGLGLQPFCSFGGTFLDVQCNGSANLAVNSNPGYDNLTFNASSGSATMNFGLTAGVNVEFFAFGDTLNGSLNINQLPNNGNLGFFDTTSFSSYLLNTPATLTGSISPNLASINTLDALTAWFGIVIPSWLAGINFDLNADIGLNQTVSGTGINTSAGEIESEGAPTLAYVNGGNYQLQNISENWNDSATLTLGLGADLSADLLWGAVSVTLVNFGNVPLISANQQYAVTSDPISNVTFNLTSFNVTASAGTGGTISPDGIASVAAGESLQLTATPLVGYVVGTWTVNGVPFQSGGSSFTLNNIQANTTVSVTFTSVGSRPSAITGAAGSVGSTSAQIGGRGNPNRYPTYAWILWGTSTSYGNQTVYGNQFPETETSIGSGTNWVGLSASLVNLSPGTVYHFELVCSNANGVTYGGDQTFTTLLNGSAPTIVNFSIVTNATYVTVTFGVNPGSQPAIVSVLSGPTPALGTITPQPPFTLPGVSYNIGIGPVTVNGFSPGTTNFIEAVATNAIGGTASQLIEFVTLGVPATATTSPASGVTATTAIANGVLGPNNIPGWFCFEVSSNGGNPFFTPLVYAGNGASNINVSAELSNLVPSTQYNVQMLASNSVATVLGSSQTFTTAALVSTLLSISIVPDGSELITATTPPGQPNVLLISTNLGGNSIPVYTNIGPFVFTNTYNFPYCYFKLRSP